MKFVTHTSDEKSVNDIKINKKLNKIIALAGNPNVGKSTVFNALTGMHQHTGNWTGKTVSTAYGYCENNGTEYILVDLPGCYSLNSHSAEEEVSRDFLCYGENNTNTDITPHLKCDGAIIVCDASCIERNLLLVYQIAEITSNVIVCVNLMDEAKKKGILIDTELIGQRLGFKIIETSARSGEGLNKLLSAINLINFDNFDETNRQPLFIQYCNAIEAEVAEVCKIIDTLKKLPQNRWTALRIIESDKEKETDEIKKIPNYDNLSFEEASEITEKIKEIKEKYSEIGYNHEKINDIITATLVNKAEDVCRDAIQYTNKNKLERDRRIDKIFTGKLTAYPIMFLLLIGIFWLTITGANYPSEFLSFIFGKLELGLVKIFEYVLAPKWLTSLVIYGIYRVVAWIISVMLPPMMIFFPMFTLLEDLGYLPRIAFNLDRCYKKCGACGKQALTTCMGLGCNAVGIVGCRIIDSPRERLIAMITNNFIPCNGRFPTLIIIVTMFFLGGSQNVGQSFLFAFFMTLIIVFAFTVTFIVSWILSKTLLKGETSSFTLELPPYRRPQILKIIVRSVFDRTLFVLGRAVTAAIPAGLILWICANITIGDATILSHVNQFFDPFARLIGMDGVILCAFILGMPANEIVIPIIIMSYMAQGTLMDISDPLMLHTLLISQGWTWITAVNVILFSLMHWPCTTTLMTIKKESKSTKWTVISFVIPTICGITICMTFTFIAKIFFG